jgi:(2Fe-2S) ferredoxin
VGGDRFAANVVVFPYGIYYGRITPEEASEVIRRTEAREIWLERYRGRSTFPRIVQAAEYFARRESNDISIHGFLDYTSEPLPGGRTRVRFPGGRTVDLELTQSQHKQRLTCSAAEPSPVPEYRLIRYAHET